MPSLMVWAYSTSSLVGLLSSKRRKVADTAVRCEYLNQRRDGLWRVLDGGNCGLVQSEA